MKKWFKMPSEQAFQAMYPPKDDAFDRAVRATLDALPDDGAGRKHAARKVSVVLAVAMLMLALACAAVAAGLESWRSRLPAQAIPSCIARWMKRASCLMKRRTCKMQADRRFGLRRHMWMGKVCLWPMS